MVFNSRAILSINAGSRDFTIPSGSKNMVSLGWLRFWLRLPLLLLGILTWGAIAAYGNVENGEPVRTIVQQGHHEEATSLAFTPDGRLLGSASLDSTIIIWDFHSGKQICSFSRHERVYSIAISPDGRFLASGEKSNIIRIWDLQSGREVKHFKHSHSQVASVAISPDGKFLLAAGGWEIKMWNLFSGKEIFSDFGGDALRSVIFSQDGKIFASTSRDALNLWEVASGKKLLTLDGGGKALAFSPNGDFISCGYWNGKIKIFRVKDGTEVTTLESYDNKEITSLIWNGENLISGDWNKKIRIWSITNEKVMKELDGKGVVGSLALSPDGKFLLAGNRWGEIIVYDLNIAKEVKILKGSESVKCVAFSQNKALFASGIEANIIDLWDGKRMVKQNTFYPPNMISSITFSPDGRLLASAGGSDSVVLWEIPSGRKFKVLKLYDSLREETPYDMIMYWDKKSFYGSFSADGRYLAVSGWKGRNKIWDVDTGEELMMKVEGRIYQGAFSPQKNLLATVDDKAVKFWDILQEKLIKSFSFKDIGEPMHHKDIHAIAWSSDGRLLAGGGSSNNVFFVIWDVSSGKRIKLYFNAGLSIIHAMNFSHDRRFLAMGDKSGKIIIYDMKSGKIIKSIKDHTFDIKSLAFSPDDSYLASASLDGTIRFWRPPSFDPLLTLYLYDKDNYLVLTPEGFFAGMGNLNKNVHFTKGLTVYEVNQFYDAFYRPDLVEKKLRGEDLSRDKNRLNLEDALRHPPPKVEILAPQEGQEVVAREVTVRVKVQDAGGQVGDIRLLHNGKLVESLGVYRLAREEGPAGVALARAEGGGRGGVALRRVTIDPKAVQSTPFQAQSGTVTREYQVTLVNGDNTLTACAFNGPNTVMSEMVSVRVQCLAPSRPPELYVLTVGLNTFHHPGLPNLRNAVKDARDLAGLLAQAAQPLYHKVHVQALLEEEASKANILKAARDLGQRMWPEDVLVVAMATHGRADGYRYFLYTHAPGGGDSPERMLTSPELMEISKTFRALKQVWFLDTCQAGGIKGAMTPLYDGRVSVLAKALGMHVLAGAGSEQVARDQYQGNGLFTHFILKGLKGEADANQDGRVQVQELGAYLNRMVGEASRGDQVPFIRTFGEDLPLAQVSR
ncbi:MAG: hypothetical protein FJ135_04910 [Deltaproteobacteria bacterium]|nr:hypothetical protein [Deltaproteobacteria bacterium]